MTDLLREPTASEIDFFRANPDVAGMAASDNRVILNPFSKLNPRERDAVVLNETARVKMRSGNLKPKFKLTDKQAEAFKDYSPREQDRRETIAARILSGDPSALDVTKEQRDFVKRLSRGIGTKTPAQKTIIGEQ